MKIKKSKLIIFEDSGSLPEGYIGGIDPITDGGKSMGATITPFSIGETKLHYVPTIEEMHVGFRYEDFYRDGKIHPDADYEKCKKQNVIPMLYSEPSQSWHKKELDWTVDSLSNLMYKIQKQLVRVKALDKQDIIECGFSEDLASLKQKEREIWFGKVYFHAGIKKGICYYYITFNDESHHVSIDIHNTEVMKPYEVSTIFSGFIKNYNELEKVIKQLNIE